MSSWPSSCVAPEGSSDGSNGSSSWPSVASSLGMGLSAANSLSGRHPYIHNSISICCLNCLTEWGKQDNTASHPGSTVHAANGTNRFTANTQPARIVVIKTWLMQST